MNKLRFAILFPLIISFANYSYIGMIEKSKDNQTSLSGKITDIDTGEKVFFANVALYNKDFVLISACESDLEGNYYFAELESGIYNIEVSFIGYKTETLKEIVIYQDQHNIIDISLKEGMSNKEISKTYRFRKQSAKFGKPIDSLSHNIKQNNNHGNTIQNIYPGGVPVRGNLIPIPDTLK